MGHSHDHEIPENGAMDLRLWASAALNGAITLAEFFGGLLSGSLALLSDAAHNLSDVAAVVLALWARHFGRRPPTARHTYGFKRVEVLAALANAVVLIAITVLIAREALVRLAHPEPVQQGLMLAVALVALFANVGSVFLLKHHEKDDVNVRSAFLHMAQDALASLAVVIAALLAHTRAGPYVDPAAALLVGLVVLRSALLLVWETVSTLMEGAPSGADPEAIAQDVGRAFPSVRLHHLHVWQNGPGQRLLTAHVALERDMAASAAEKLFDEIRAHLHEEWAITHATLEPEVEGCGETELLGRWEDHL
ncbi:MAG: cation diffusion facilitator family transporter [Acidobacteriota bacterium]